MSSSRQLAAIMFTDIVGYTALMGKDSNKALELVRKSKEIQKPLVEQHNGKWLKEMGDGAMAQFASALDSVNCAIEIQETARAKLDGKLRIGIHSGDITIENDDVYGDGVNIASRLESIADPGGIYISDAIEKAIRGQISLQAGYLGEIKLKNVDYGVRTYALQGVGLPVPDVQDQKELSGHFLAELQRRGVIRAGVTYLIVSMLLILMLRGIESWLTLPLWSLTALITTLSIGLPVSLYLAWNYERSPEGFVRTSSQQSWQNPYTTVQKKPMTSNVIIIGMGLIIVLMIFYPRLFKSGSEAPVSVGDMSIAVLPFTDLSPNKDQEYFSDGISEEIINTLARVPGLKVAGRTSSFSFKDKDETLPFIGKLLGVSNILEGSVRKSGNQLRITAQLVNTEDGFQLWTETYDREMTDIFLVQDEITNSIVEALKVYLEGEQPVVIVSAQTDLSAYEIYLKARQKLAARGENLFEAKKLFEQVLEIDPNYAPAQSGLAKTLCLMPTWTFTPTREVVEPAKIAAYKAIGLNPNSAEAHSVLGYILSQLEWHWEEAEKYLERSTQLKPNDTEMLNFLGDFYLTIGHPKALEVKLRALELDPLHPIKHGDVARSYRAERNWAKVGEYSSNCLRLDSSMLYVARIWVSALIADSDLDKAEEVMNSFQDADGPNYLFIVEMHAALALAKGNKDQANKLMEQLKVAADNGEFSSARVAHLYIQAGLMEEAAPWIVKAYENRDPFLVGTTFWISVPEKMPDHPALRAALDKPELNALFEIRRRNHVN